MSARPMVVDASAAVYLASMQAWPGVASYEFHAPPLMWSEALAALAQAAYRGELPAHALEASLERLEGLPILPAPANANHRREALRIAVELGWARTYDAEYVALARSLDCPLLTVDKRLQRGAERLIEVLEPVDIV